MRLQSNRKVKKEMKKERNKVGKKFGSNQISAVGAENFSQGTTSKSEVVERFYFLKFKFTFELEILKLTFNCFNIKFF